MLNQIVNRLVLWGFLIKNCLTRSRCLRVRISKRHFRSDKRRKTPKPTKYIVNVNSNSQSETVNADINTQK